MIMLDPLLIYRTVNKEGICLSHFEFYLCVITYKKYILLLMNISANVILLTLYRY